DNGGPFTVWQQNVTATSATFAGVVGHTYRFYSIARDVVGNVEAAKSAAEATTTIINPPATPLLSITKSHTGNFTQGQQRATYTVTVSNTGTAPTGGTV